jgi:hypothetical protein
LEFRDFFFFFDALEMREELKNCSSVLVDSVKDEDEGMNFHHSTDDSEKRERKQS